MHIAALQLSETSALESRVTGTDVAVIAAVVIGTALLTRLIRPLARKALNWLARRSLASGTGRWRVRSPRGSFESAEVSELRRRQRITATAAGLSRIASAILWVVALLLVLHRVDIDPVFAISAAGFVGVALSIGGQHSVNDFLTGLHILIEDRFGEGDELELKVHDEVQNATVVYLGAFATRLQGEAATYHVPNRDMTSVINLSQRGATAEVKFEPSGQVPAVGSKMAVEAAVRSRYKSSTGFDASRDGLIVDSVKEDDDNFLVRVRTARPLTKSQRDELGNPASSSASDDH